MINYYINEYNGLFPNGEENDQTLKADALVIAFCFKPDTVSGTSDSYDEIGIVGGFGHLYQVYYTSKLNGTGTITLEGYFNNNGSKRFLMRSVTGDITENQWNNIVYVAYIDRQTGNVKYSCCVNGTYKPTQNLLIWGGGSMTASPNEAFLSDESSIWIGANFLYNPYYDFWVPDLAQDGFDWCSFYCHFYTPETQELNPNAQTIYNLMFGTGGAPALSERAEELVGEVPLWYLPDGSILRNKGVANNANSYVADWGVISESASTPYGAPVGVDDDLGAPGLDIVWTTSPLNVYDIQITGTTVFGSGLYFNTGSNGLSSPPWHSTASYYTSGGSPAFVTVIHEDYVIMPWGDGDNYFIMKIDPVSGDTNNVYIYNNVTGYPTVGGGWGGSTPPNMSQWIGLGRGDIDLAYTNSPAPGSYSATVDISVARCQNPTDTWTNYAPVTDSIVTKRVTINLTITAS